MSIFDFLVGLSLFIVLAVLFTGIVSMVRGGEFNRKYGNKLMRLRVGAQMLAIAMLGLAFLLDG
ncbi:twin transmembrane helix small protein [Minwuia thermotolerans]|jgi:hypothetical protein|uniref:HIG1 domain-containing protein n=1 Tax=Minwuia thermotolerans TaxID=2056226 RepID=A0A2M9G4J6_9PROT|nr:twin transmembrane helix small protein [Minwuia thermotolerans]ANK79511.1 MAG: hypothetical protein TEF_00925 [Rhizobiales bacterium NRL2]PJK30596.1 hypothetical protein CVT23_06540 [Minwuia thermotolerans]